MCRFIAGIAVAIVSWSTMSAPSVYTDRTDFLAELAAQGIFYRSESFENESVWAASRNSIVAPGSTTAVTSKGITWTSNYPQNNIATGDVGGSAPAGTYAIYSLPHGMDTDSGLYCDSAEDPDIPPECFLNDGLKVAGANSETLYAFGGRIDTSNSGKVTFLLDGIDVNADDAENIDNWQREGDLADHWGFVGVIDPEGFSAAELRELKGKDYQQVYLFADAFIIGVTVNDGDGDGVADPQDYYPHISLNGRLDTDHDGIPDDCDPDCLLLGMSGDLDDDGDGFIDGIDNCPLIYNPDQSDADGDGAGDACDLPPGC